MTDTSAGIRQRRIRLAIVASLAMAAALVSALGFFEGRGGPPPATASIGAAAPPLAGRTIDGTPLDLAAYRGHPVMINFWASWCGPCRSEFHMFDDALSKYRGAGLVVIGVLYDDGADPARAFASTMHASWQTLTDTDGAFAREYRVVGAPQTWFVDKGGILRGLQVGPLVPGDLDQEMPKLVGDSNPPPGP